MKPSKLQRTEFHRDFFRHEVENHFDLYDFNESMDPNFFTKLGIKLADMYRDSFEYQFDTAFYNYDGE
jgi:NOL1/NOP2/fmu family ribosome biogenesis protein